jgi:hypothetical protein
MWALDGRREKKKSRCGQPEEEEGRRESSRVVLAWWGGLFLALAVVIDLDHVISSSGQSFVPSRRTFVCIVKAS